MSRSLLDAGPLIAVLRRRDPDHDRCVRALSGFRGSLITTGAVVTETMHFVATDREGPAAVVDFLEDAGVEVVDCISGDRLRAAVALMTKYSDVPMDFADASLVVAADETGTADIFTLDERGFRTYRFRGTKRFRLILDDH